MALRVKNQQQNNVFKLRLNELTVGEIWLSSKWNKHGSRLDIRATE